MHVASELRGGFDGDLAPSEEEVHRALPVLALDVLLLRRILQEEWTTGEWRGKVEKNRGERERASEKRK